MVFSCALALGALGLIAFANRHYGMTGFAALWPVYVTPALAIVGYILAKRLQRAERVFRREHGFIEELRRNWILFVFLIPCFVFFIINNYLPMVGIYFAFTQFNFKDSLFASPFVGFKNFEFLMRSEIVHLTVNTILYNIVFIVVGNVLRQYLAPLQAGLVPDVDAAVEEFRQKVTDAGLDACREGFEEQWADYCVEYGYDE